MRADIETQIQRLADRLVTLGASRLERPWNSTGSVLAMTQARLQTWVDETAALEKMPPRQLPNLHPGVIAHAAAVCARDLAQAYHRNDLDLDKVSTQIMQLRKDLP